MSRFDLGRPGVKGRNVPGLTTGWGCAAQRCPTPPGVTAARVPHIPGVAGEEWQCAELVNRLYLTKGWITSHWKGDAGEPMWDQTPANLASGKQAEGSVSYLGPGDVVFINVYYDGSYDEGHALVVNVNSKVTRGDVELVSQNSGYDATSEPVVEGTLENGHVVVGGGGRGWSYTTIGVVHAPPTNPAPQPPAPAPTLNFTPGSAFRDECVIAWPTAPTYSNSAIEMTMSGAHVPESEYTAVRTAFTVEPVR